MSKIRTASGRLLDVANPNPDDILIEDIARGLSNTCRFTGQIPNGGFYSVAQHSHGVVSRAVGAGVTNHDILGALLHDASEAYICDLPTPVKLLLPDYRRLEEGLQAAIYQKFGVKYDGRLKAFIGWLDHAVLDTEWKLIQQSARPHHLWSPQKAYDVFMDDFRSVSL